jgi:hypothetical protein
VANDHGTLYEGGVGGAKGGPARGVGRGTSRPNGIDRDRVKPREVSSSSPGRIKSG